MNENESYMDSVEEYIDLLHEKAFSGADILKFLNYKCNLMTYPELTNCESIFDAMGEHKALVLLYLTKENFGHWVCVFEHDNGKIEFFDSYGTIIDDQLKQIKSNFRKVSNQDYPHLTYLLYNSNRPVEYNHTPLQKKYTDKGRTVSTCGRHVCVRLIARKMPLTKYIKLIKKQHTDPDSVVTFLTHFV
jgi:hypothetical protein